MRWDGKTTCLEVPVAPGDGQQPDAEGEEPPVAQPGPVQPQAVREWHACVYPAGPAHAQLAATKATTSVSIAFP